MVLKPSPIYIGVLDLQGSSYVGASICLCLSKLAYLCALINRRDKFWLGQAIACMEVRQAILACLIMVFWNSLL